MSKHTPGPWGLIIGDAGPIVFSGNKGSMVATCVKKITSAERDANARLIAAAPDLLKYLQWAVDNPGDNAFWIEQSKDAIAKATGG